MSIIRDLTEHLQSRSPQFIAKLEEIERRTCANLQTRLSTGEVVLDTQGQFTGRDLCTLSSGALEQGLITKFGDVLDINGVIIEFPIEEGQKYASNHVILHAKPIVSGPAETVSIDATPRQINFCISNQIHVFPTVEEGIVYPLATPIAILRPRETASFARGQAISGGRKHLIYPDFRELVKIISE